MKRSVEIVRAIKVKQQAIDIHFDEWLKKTDSLSENIKDLMAELKEIRCGRKPDQDITL